MKNRWNYEGLGQVQYGNVPSYELSCSWLDAVEGTVEDWGCGCAFARRFFKKSKYVGIDGSQNEFADVCGIDLQDYHSAVDGILLRHVLDHNEGWERILENALNSFQKRMVVVFFIEFGPTTRVLSRSQDAKYLGVPDIQFNREEVLNKLSPFLTKEHRIPITDYLVDTLFFLSK